MRVRRKTVEVDATQWTPALGEGSGVCAKGDGRFFFITELGARVWVAKNDWILTTRDAEGLAHYEVCPADQFEATYERLDGQG